MSFFNIISNLLQKYFNFKRFYLKKMYLIFYNCSLRGRLGSLTVLARNLGVLLAYIVGSFVEYEIIPVIFIYIPIIYTVCLFFLPNTPQYHLSKGNFKVN